MRADTKKHTIKLMKVQKLQIVRYKKATIPTITLTLRVWVIKLPTRYMISSQFHKVARRIVYNKLANGAECTGMKNLEEVPTDNIT